jgi:hypothetical protein
MCGYWRVRSSQRMTLRCFDAYVGPFLHGGGDDDITVPGGSIAGSFVPFTPVGVKMASRQARRDRDLAASL